MAGREPGGRGTRPGWAAERHTVLSACRPPRAFPGSLPEGGRAGAGQAGLESPRVEGCGDEWFPAQLTVGVAEGMVAAGGDTG